MQAGWDIRRLGSAQVGPYLPYSREDIDLCSLQSSAGAGSEGQDTPAELTASLTFFGALPPELLLLVLDVIAPDDVSDSEARRRETKRIISVASLVCKAWFKHIRHWLFAKVVLRSHTDIDFFSNILRSSPCKDSVHAVQHLEVREDRLGLHFVARLLQHRLPSLKSVYFNCLLSDSHFALFSASQYPVVDPSATLEVHRSIQTVVKLELCGCRFTSFSTFSRLVQGFMTLEELHCTALSWPRSSRHDQSLRPSRSQCRRNGSRT